MKSETATEVVKTPDEEAEAERLKARDAAVDKAWAGLEALGDAYQKLDSRPFARAVDMLFGGVKEIFGGLREVKKTIEEGKAKELIPGAKKPEEKP